MKSFSVVEAKAFICMLKKATLGQYNEISLYTLNCRAIPKICKFMKKTIIDLLNAEKDGIEAILLKSDIWSARTKHFYISLTLPRQKFFPEKIPFCLEVFSRRPYGK